MLGGLISAGSSLLGGLIGAKASRDNTTDQLNFARDQSAENTALQREFAQNGIRWRVDDAKAAGLHPLYAIGGAGSAFTPSAASVNFDNGGQHLGRAIADAGQSIGRGLQAQQTPAERAIQQANLALLQSQLGESDARRQLLIAQAAKLAQEAVASKPLPTTVPNAYGSLVGPATGAVDYAGHPLSVDALEITPEKIVSRSSIDPGQTAGREHPGMREFRFPGGHRELLPAADGSGVPEEVSWVNIPEWLGANLHRYGWRWLVNKIGNITGQTPDMRRERGSLESWLRSRRQPPDHPAFGGRSDHSLAGTRRR